MTQKASNPASMAHPHTNLTQDNTMTTDENAVSTPTMHKCSFCPTRGARLLQYTPEGLRICQRCRRTEYSMIQAVLAAWEASDSAFDDGGMPATEEYRRVFVGLLAEACGPYAEDVFNRALGRTRGKYATLSLQGALVNELYWFKSF